MIITSVRAPYSDQSNVLGVESPQEIRHRFGCRSRGSTFPTAVPQLCKIGTTFLLTWHCADNEIMMDRGTDQAAQTAFGP